MNMKKIATVIAVLAFVTTVSFAQSTGNFTFGNTGTTHCTLNGTNGVISGGDICSQGSCFADADCAGLGTGATCVGGNATTNTLGYCQLPGQTCKSGQPCGTCTGHLNAGIKVSSGNGNVLVIRPSAVIGLLTDVSLQKTATTSVGTSSAYAGVDFEVLANGVGNGTGNALPAPCVTPNFKVTYAARFIQISSNIFDVLSTTCTATTSTLPSGAVGCYFNFAESTVSAHSFDWIVGAPQAANAQPANCSALSSGDYGITANWYASLGNTGISQALTCVGPINLTVQQNKIFGFNTVN